MNLTRLMVAKLAGACAVPQGNRPNFTGAVRGVVAVDGKTLRRSFDHAAEQGPIQ